MGEYIDRQAAIDALMDYSEMYAVNIIKSVPSAQPDLIQCKDCIHRHGDYCHCSDGIVQYGTYVKESDYCSKGERREDG